MISILKYLHTCTLSIKHPEIRVFRITNSKRNSKILGFHILFNENISSFYFIIYLYIYLFLFISALNDNFFLADSCLLNNIGYFLYLIYNFFFIRGVVRNTCGPYERKLFLAFTILVYNWSLDETSYVLVFLGSCRYTSYVSYIALFF